MLQSQVQTSEALLQDLQKSFSQSQNAVQSRLVSDVSVLQSVYVTVSGMAISLKEKKLTIWEENICLLLRVQSINMLMCVFSCKN